MLDPHIEAISAAEPGRRVLVSEPCPAAYVPQWRNTVLKPGTLGLVRRIEADHLMLEVRSGGGAYLLRVMRADYPCLDLEPER